MKSRLDVPTSQDNLCTFYSDSLCICPFLSFGCLAHLVSILRSFDLTGQVRPRWCIHTKATFSSIPTNSLSLLFLCLKGTSFFFFFFLPSLLPFFFGSVASFSLCVCQRSGLCLPAPPLRRRGRPACVPLLLSSVGTPHCAALVEPKTQSSPPSCCPTLEWHVCFVAPPDPLQHRPPPPLHPPIPRPQPKAISSMGLAGGVKLTVKLSQH